MSWFDYQQARNLEGHSFYALLMAAIAKADTANLAKLRGAFPDVVAEWEARYDAPGGHLPND